MTNRDLHILLNDETIFDRLEGQPDKEGIQMATLISFIRLDTSEYLSELSWDFELYWVDEQRLLIRPIIWLEPYSQYAKLFNDKINGTGVNVFFNVSIELWSMEDYGTKKEYTPSTIFYVSTTFDWKGHDISYQLKSYIEKWFKETTEKYSDQLIARIVESGEFKMIKEDGDIRYVTIEDDDE